MPKTAWALSPSTLSAKRSFPVAVSWTRKSRRSCEPTFNNAPLRNMSARASFATSCDSPAGNRPSPFVRRLIRPRTRSVEITSSDFAWARFVVSSSATPRSNHSSDRSSVKFSMATTARAFRAAGARGGRKSQYPMIAAAMMATPATAISGLRQRPDKRVTGGDTGATAAATARPESVSRFRRFKSVRSSEAL